MDRMRSGDLLATRDLHALPFLERVHEGGRVDERLEGAGVERAKAAAHQFRRAAYRPPDNACWK
jgi:hypothetical protein